MTTVLESPVIFTEGAMIELDKLKKQSTLNMYLRIGVKGGGCSGMSYVLENDTKTEQDELYIFNGIEYIISPSHLIYLQGIEIDFEQGLNSRGFTFKNPNASSTCGCGSSFAV